MATDLGAPDTGLFARLWDDARSHLLVVGAGLVVTFLLVKKFGTAAKPTTVTGVAVQSTTAGYQVPGSPGPGGPPGPPGPPGPGGPPGGGGGDGTYVNPASAAYLDALNKAIAMWNALPPSERVNSTYGVGPGDVPYVHVNIWHPAGWVPTPPGGAPPGPGGTGIAPPGGGRGGASPVKGNQGPAVGQVGQQAGGGKALGPATTVPKAAPALLTYPAPLAVHPIGTTGF